MAKKHRKNSGSSSTGDVLRRPLETHDAQDHWLRENRDEINRKIRRGIEQLERGEGIPEEKVKAYMARLKAEHE